MDVLIKALDVVEKAQRQNTEIAFDLLGIANIDLSHHSQYEIALYYALAQHFIEGAKTAAKNRDSETFQWYKHDAQSSIASSIQGLGFETVVSRRILSLPKYDGTERLLDISPGAQRHSLASPPCALIWSGTFDRDPHQQLILQQAFQLGIKCGFTTLLGMHAAITVLSPENAAGDGTTNWTVASLPGTVFLTRSNEPLLLGREVVHEAGHNWLNDAFEFTHSVPEDKFYFSPWKLCMRPAFGFIHAYFAFPLTVLYSIGVFDLATPSIQRELDDYIKLHKSALTYVKADFCDALRLVRDDRVASVLNDVFFSSLNS